MKKTTLYFLLISIFHCILSVIYTSAYSYAVDDEAKIIYFFSKIISFGAIILLWQAIGLFLKAIFEGNKKIIDFGKYTLIYFIVNLILFLTFYPIPESHVDITGQYVKASHYFFDWWMYFVQNCICMIFYHLLPTFKGYIISSLMYYSLIFGYCIYSIKYNISEKYYKLMMIPFFLPMILLYNEIPRRNVLAGWLFIFVFIFLVVNRKKEHKNYYTAVFTGIVTALLTHFRYEFCILTIIVPIVVYIYKIFDKRRFFTFLTIFIITFTSIFLIQKDKIPNYQYERENLSFVVRTLTNGIDYKYSEKDLEILNKVLIKENNDNIYINEFAEKKDIEKAIIQIKKLMIKNFYYLVRENYKGYLNSLNNNDFMKIKSSKVKEYFPRPMDNYFENSFYTHNEKEKLTSKLIYFTDNFECNNALKFLYSMKINFLIVMIMFIMGLIMKKTIYTVFAVIWSLIILLILSVSFVSVFIYYYPFIQNTIIMFIVMITEMVEKRGKKEI